MKTPLRVHLLPLLLCAVLAACSSEDAPGPTAAAAAAVPAVARTPLEPLPPLRTGRRALAAGTELVGTVAASLRDADHEYLRLRLPLAEYASDANFDQQHVELGGADDSALAVFEPGAAGGDLQLLLRRKRVDGQATPSGALFLRSWQSGSRHAWQRVPFRIDGGVAATTDASLKTQWLTAFGSQFGVDSASSHPWSQFASGRVLALLPGGLAKVASAVPGQTAPSRRTELSQLMATTTGMLSTQEALQYDRGLRLDRTPAKRGIAVDTLALPALDAHPFAAMQATLAKPDGGTAEPLAAAVPADFWYARVDDIRLLLRLLDEADAWITPVAQILESSPQDQRLSERYQAQLGLRRSGMAKLLGHTVVGSVAITGSDPYLREGSDLTLIFSVRQQTVFDAELARHLDTYESEIPTLVSSTRDYQGVSVTESRDPDGLVRQQRAQVGELALVSNSPRAMERVLDAIGGRSARLSDEADLKYMLARDPGTHQAFAFLSDKFIARVIGPQQKVLAARRQQALAELLTPGYAALLHGWLFNQPPASTEALMASGLLAADELQHVDGGAIAFAPGHSASSSWGRPAALTPLIDLPPVTAVSEAEKVAYEAFVSGYQQYWKQFIDPVAVRLDVVAQGGAERIQLDVRILPLISGTDYSEIAAVVGNTRVTVNALDRGVQAVWAVGAEARLRKDLDSLVRSAIGQDDVGLGWLGNWVALGLEDRATLVELLSRFDDSVQLALPKPAGDEFQDLDLWQRVGKFPIYAAAEVKNPVMLVATLAALRTMLGQVAPGMIDWSESEKYRQLPIVRIGVNKTAPLLPNPQLADAVALHYVQTGSAFVIALNPQTLHSVIDRLLDGQAPQAAPEGSAQFVFEGRSPVGAPLWTALSWAIQGQANEAQASARRSAEILLRGDPAAQANPARFAQTALDYFGFVPVTAQGDWAFTLQPGGAGDAVSGTTMEPAFVELPIAGSPVERLLQRLTGVRGEISFDQEPALAGPNARSLHTRLLLDLGAP